MKLALILIASCCSLYPFAQTKGSIKLYGYVQYVSGGKAPDASSNNTRNLQYRSGKNYLIYAVSPTAIAPVRLWIQGKLYSVSFRSINQTPVQLNDDGNMGAIKQTLVPKTTQKVVQLVPGPVPNGRSKTEARLAEVATNEVVLIYRTGTRLYYATLKKLSAINGGAMQ